MDCQKQSNGNASWDVLYTALIGFRRFCRILPKWVNFFFFFYPHTLTFRLKRPVYRGFSGEGKCEGKLSPLTLTLTPKSVLNPFCPARHNQNQKKIKKRIRVKDSVASVIIRERF